MGILNTSYAKNHGRCAGPIFIPEEVYSFYINFEEPVNDPAFADFRLDLIQNGVLVLAGIGTLSMDVLVTGFYNIKCAFSFPAGVLHGKYNLRIYNTGTATTLATSNIIEVYDAADVGNTAFVAYRHKYNKYEFRYEENPTFYNKFRLALIQVNEQQFSERKQYRNVSNRRLRNLKSYKDQIITIESYYFTSLMHAAISAMYEHDEIYVDNTFVVPKGAYEIEENRQSVITKATCDVIVDEDAIPPAGAVWPVVVLVTNDTVTPANDNIDIFTDEDEQIFVTA